MMQLYSVARYFARGRSAIVAPLMQIEFADFTAGARDARGVVIVVDVFRACSLIAHAIAAGARRVVPVAEIEDARALKHAHPDWHVIGERYAKPLPGFDGGNSPTELLRHPLAGRTIAHTTHAGTQGLTGALHATHVFTGALVNATATVRVIQELAPPYVTIVRMGQNALKRCTEDDLCADLLAARFSGAAFDVAGVRERLRQAPAAAKFFDPAATWAPEGDFELCTAVDSLDIAVALRHHVGEPPALERAG